MKKITNFILSIIDYIFFIFPIKKNRIICSNFSGKKYDGNTKYFCDKLLEKYVGLDVYCLGKKNEKVEGIKYVKFPSLKALYIFSTSKIWISNVRLPIWINKKKNQFYIQVWHGKATFKNVEKLAEDSLDKNYIETAKKDSKKIDLLISPDKYNTEFLKSCFWYDGKIVEYDLGYSFKEEYIKNKEKIKNKIRKMYNVKENEKIILYAPTFRKYEFDYNLEFNNIGDNYKVFIKLHPGLKNTKIKNKNIINVTNYNNIDELLVSCDILISDYSSIVFDYLFYNDEVYLYAPDYDEYKNDRGFYIDYKKLPFSISYSNEELEKAIINHLYKETKKELDNYLKENGFNIDNTKNIKEVYKIIDNIL